MRPQRVAGRKFQALPAVDILIKIRGGIDGVPNRSSSPLNYRGQYYQPFLSFRHYIPNGFSLNFLCQRWAQAFDRLPGYLGYRMSKRISVYQWYQVMPIHYCRTDYPPSISRENVFCDDNLARRSGKFIAKGAYRNRYRRSKLKISFACLNSPLVDIPAFAHRFRESRSTPGNI